MLCFAKSDLPESQCDDEERRNMQGIAVKHGFADCVAVSAKTGDGCAELLRVLLGRLLPEQDASRHVVTAILRDAAQGYHGGAPALSALCDLLSTEPDDPRERPLSTEEWTAALRTQHDAPPALTREEHEEIASQLINGCGGRGVDHQEMVQRLFAEWDPTECGAIPKQAYRTWWLHYVADRLALPGDAALRCVDRTLRPHKSLNEQSLSWAEFTILLYGIARL